MNSAAFVVFTPLPVIRGIGFALAGVAAVGIFLGTYWARKRVRRVRTGDQQGDVYVAARIAASWRQRKRNFDFRPLDSKSSDKQLSFDPYRPPKWKKIEAGLQEFGSESVRAAAQAASAANQAAMASLAEWTRDQSENNRRAALRARTAADDADGALVKRISHEMHAKGMRLADWVPGPAGDGA